MANNYNYDLIVIGSGPGGYVSAVRAAQLGMSVAIVEKDKPGGVCLNVGCIPSKSLIHSAELYRSMQHLNDWGVDINTSRFKYAKVQKKSREAANKLSKGVEYLLKKNKIELIKGVARLAGKNQIIIDGKKKITALNILIATGSRPKEIPGFEIDEQMVLSSTGMLMLEELPYKLLILGAGAIGIEFASVMNSFGVEVTVIEMLDNILPQEDHEVVEVLRKSLTKRGISIYTSTKANELKKDGKAVCLKIEKADGSVEELKADKLLLSVGRTPNSEELGLEELGINRTRGFIDTGDYYETGQRGVYAIGDVINTPLLAHVASKEGEIAVERMAGHTSSLRVENDLIPSAVYCEPQVARFGPVEEEVKKAGTPYRKAVFPYRGIGKAIAVESAEGMVKILVDEKTEEIISAHIVGLDATELIHELLLAKKSELFCEDIATMIHAHPTISEGVMEAARAAEDWAIHI